MTVGLALGILGVIGVIIALHGFHGISSVVIGSAGVALLVSGALVLHHAGYLRSIAERRVRRRADHEGSREHGSAL
jgi:hypothetical protein